MYYSVCYINLLITMFLTIFRRFPTIFRRFPKIFKMLSKGRTNDSKHFPNFSEHFRRLSRKIQRCFDLISINFGSLSIETRRTLQILHFRISLTLWEQRWRRGESAQLPPMWPEFNFRPVPTFHFEHERWKPIKICVWNPFQMFLSTVHSFCFIVQESMSCFL